MKSAGVLLRVGGACAVTGALILGSGVAATALSKDAPPVTKSAVRPPATKTKSTTKHFFFPRITSVTFSGTVNQPTISIRGYDLGREPATYPAFQPAGHTGCALLGMDGSTTSFGYDYGTALFIHDSSSSPVWGAGRFRPGVGELDCVGVIVKSFTTSRIVLTLGAAYPSYPAVSATYALNPGDRYDVHVNGATYKGRVRYTT